MKPGNIITVTIYGRPQRVKVLKVHHFGTVDVMRSDGSCFRLSGLSLVS